MQLSEQQQRIIHSALVDRQHKLFRAKNDPNATEELGSIMSLIRSFEYNLQRIVKAKEAHA